MVVYVARIEDQQTCAVSEEVHLAQGPLHSQTLQKPVALVLESDSA